MTRASNAELESTAQEIFNILRICDSPKDAGMVLALSYCYMMKSAFAPEDNNDAFKAIDETSKFVKDYLSEEWH